VPGETAKEPLPLPEELTELVSRADPARAPSLLDAVNDPGEAAISDEGKARLERFTSELAELRRHLEEPVPELVRRVISRLGLEAEQLVRGDTSQLARFIAACSTYPDIDGDGGLAGLLAWLDVEEEHGDALERVTPTAADSVKLLTVHRAKGLEWHTVYLPALSEGVFPGTDRTGNWSTNSRLLPAPLRGDADAIPQLADYSKRGIDAYRDFAVVSMRSGGQTQLRVMPRGAACNGAVAAGPTEWRQATPVPSEDLATIMHLPQSHWQTGEVVYMVESVLTPRTWVSYCPHTGESTVLKRLEVPNYDREDYAQQGVWVTADDGTDIPMTIAYRKDLEPDGSNPGLIYGYGSYEVSYDPWFAPINVSALQRGVVLAFAHVRGGGEMGRAWYDDGKLLKKKNTFTDFIACAKWLHSSGWVADQRLAAEGSSAGGLLMGAVANLAPDQFRAIHADVPFVDALTTILRPELPLTVGEWEEWGNPIDSPEIYEYMRSYSPTENVVEAEYPAVLATTSFNDIRVFYVEPTKWVQILRERSSNDPIARPILEQIEMAAGHGGKLGRYDRWDKQSFELAWILDQIGATE